MSTRRITLLAASLYLLAACSGAHPQAQSWTFEQLLEPPTAAELDRVNQDWARKVWRIDNMTLAGTTTVPLGSDRFEARVYTFTLNDSRRCGAVLLPVGGSTRSLAGLVDIGDIRWDYPDRNLTNGPYVARILGDRAREFALLVPCARGMGLRIGELRVAADGDRRDAWEGVAEDAIAFVTAALSVIPQIDAKRVAAYGYSRGGGVALIVGQRDPRVRAVLAFAAPTDWFRAMGRPGETWAERLEAASQDPNLERDTREHQFLDWFVRSREELPLAEGRRRLAGASPLYYTDRLPPFQIHHGEEDSPVPVRNATAVRDRLSPHDDSRRVFIYPDAGHLLDSTSAMTTARAFLLQRVVSGN